jgi:hypothetical protein
MSTLSETRANRYFISYRHNSEEEELANYLYQGLRGRGQEVFIDESMLIGTNWVTEIRNRIEWCDIFIVLLSVESIASEMVQAEVRLAARRYRTTKQPMILPVRVRYTKSLDYELESYLGRIEYALWNTPSDSPALLEEILSASGHKIERHEPNATTLPVVIDARRPLPRVDPRVLTAPGGTLAADDPLYLCRTGDNIVETLIEQQQGYTLVIKAPRQMGKSSLLIRHLAAVIKKGKRVGFVDLSVMSQEDMASYVTFLKAFGTALLRSLGLDTSPAEKLQSQQQMTWMMEDVVLPALQSPVVLAFDEVDRVLGRPFQADFFTMLRLWTNNRTNVLQRAKWKDVSLALIISTEPYLLIPEADRSPFNVGTVIELHPFSIKEVQALNDVYQAGLSTAQVDEVSDLLNGHPFLLRMAFYNIVGPQHFSFEKLMDTAAQERGPFGEHLRALLFRLHARPELLLTLRQLIFSGEVPPDDVYYRLYGAGLVRRDGTRVVPANLLYARFFKKAL